MEKTKKYPVLRDDRRSSNSLVLAYSPNVLFVKTELLKPLLFELEVRGMVSHQTTSYVDKTCTRLEMSNEEDAKILLTMLRVMES